MKIIPDTNLIQGRGSFYFENNLWPVILAAIRNGLAELLVPEVVVQELVTHYSEDVRRSLRDLRKMHGTLGRLRVNLDVGQTHESEDDITLDYEEWLRSHIARHGRILPLPTVQHARLLKDTLLGRKPLSRGDGGYRDALIWHSVLDVARGSSDEIILLSENTRDFASRTGELSPDLQADLTTIDSQAVVRLVSNLQSLINLIVPEDPKAIETVSEFLNSESGRNTLEAALDDHFDVYQRETFTSRPRALPSWILLSDIEEFGEIRALQVLAAYRLGTDTWVVKAVLQGSAYVGGYTHPASLGHPDAEQFEVWDHLGNNQVYVAHSHAQPVRAVACFRWSTSDGVTDMTFLQIDLMTDQLTPPPDYRPASPRPSDPASACQWLRAELNRLLLLEPFKLSSALQSEKYLSEVHSALQTINSSSAVRNLPPVETLPLAPDNLGSMLTDHAGIQFLLKILGRLKFDTE